MQGAGGSTTGIYTYTLVGSNTAELYAAAATWKKLCIT